MNAWPMRRRFSCGSVTPASAARNCSSAFTTCRSVLKCSVNSSMTASSSSLRSRPLSTRMHESCGPIAWYSSAATTDESTPPERPQITRSLPTRSRICVDRLARRNRPASRCPWQPQTCVRKLRRIVAAVRRVRHFGMELQAVDRQRCDASPPRCGQVVGRGERHEVVGDAASPGRRGSSRRRSRRARRRTDRRRR